VRDLSGLWGAKKHFGPDVRGQLIVRRTPEGFAADIAGRSAPVSNYGDELAFELPGHEGHFSGRLEGKDLVRGLWERPGTPLNNRATVSPVVLKKISADVWAGQLEPLADDFSFYLFAKARADGSYDVVLRNPELDLGNQRGVNRLVRSGDALQLMASRGKAPEELLASGQMEPEMEGFSITFPGRGGTYDFAREGDASLAYPRPRSSPAYHYITPPPLGDGWPTATLGLEGINQSALERLVQSIIDMKMDAADAPEIHALLIARHGQLLFEEYFHGFSREKLHNIRSAGKSLTATAIGAAMRAGAPLRLDSRVYQVLNGGSFPPGLEPRKRAMTLENLLTMSAGYYCDDTDDKAPGNEDFIGDVLQEPDWVKYSLSVPMATDPGENSVYCSMQPNLALAMLGAATHESPVRAFDRLVARPLQITNYAWMLDPVDRPYGGGGVAIRARDFLKFGQLMLNKGTWNGHRILDPSFVKEASSPQYHLRNVYYGYLWWVEDYPYKNRTVRGYSARGSGGNLVFVIPELDLVVETMAGNYSNRRGMRYLGNVIATSILPAVREPGDDPNAPVKDREFVSPYGPSKNGSRATTRLEPDRISP
jgi:CubicO group peptidase (beta-lactamase class C family)